MSCQLQTREAIEETPLKIYMVAPTENVAATAYDSNRRKPAGLPTCNATSIPPEVLAQIIGLCRDWAWDGYLDPLPYASVCRHWRNIILTSPALWTTIQSHSSDHRASHDVSLRLQRSHNLPLSISLQDYSLSSDSLSSDSSLLAAVALQHRRWKDATLYLSQEALLAFLALNQPEAWSFNKLESFTLEVGSPYDLRRRDGQPEAMPVLLEHGCMFPADMFTNAPKLRRLHLENQTIRASDFPWSQLTSLELTRVSESEATSIQDVLQQCTSLEELFLDPWDFKADRVDLKKVVSLPSLNSLRFGSLKDGITAYRAQDPEIETPGLLASLRVPALKFLSVHGTGQTMWDACICIKASNSPPIVALCVEDYALPDSPSGFAPHILALLKMLPLLSSLSIEFSEEYEEKKRWRRGNLELPMDQLLTRLTDQKLDVCPVLRDVTLTNARPSCETPRLLIEFLESRVLTKPVRLRRMEIGMCAEGMGFGEICDEGQRKRVEKLGSGMRGFRLRMD